MLEEMFTQVRDRKPLVHCVTNYVTVNDVANVLIACGASPIMSDDVAEVEQITAICDGLVINIGTLNERTRPAMMLAGRKAAELGHATVLDPVGAGASDLRTKTASDLCDAIPFTLIRGNISEIKTLAGETARTHGVDADMSDLVADGLEEAASIASGLARRRHAVVCITGAKDILTDGDSTYVVSNGHVLMSRITGSGCMLSAVMAAFLAVNPHEPLTSALASVCAMGLAGELAAVHAQQQGYGNATFRNLLIDEIYHMTPSELEFGAKYELLA